MVAALTPTGRERCIVGCKKATGGHWVWVASQYVRSNGGESLLAEGHYERVGCQDVWVEKEIECRGVAIDDGVPREYLGWYEVRHVNGDTALSAVPGTLAWGEIIPSFGGGDDAVPS